jgi:large subunit ribosomal protein L20
MPKSSNSVASRQRRKKILKLAKGYFGRRKNVWTVAKNAVEKGLTYAYRDRKNKKRTFRALWITRINAGARIHGLSYSELMGKLKQNNIDIHMKLSKFSNFPRVGTNLSLILLKPPFLCLATMNSA